MKTISKNTLAISYNRIISDYRVKPTHPMMPEDPEYQFTEGVWNEPSQSYGDRVLLKGDLKTAKDVGTYVGSLTETIHQAVIYAGSLSEERQDWLVAAVEAVRKNNPKCTLLIFVCECANGKIGSVQRLMALTKTTRNQWFEQSHISYPHLEGDAGEIGNHPIWYTLMISRYYGQATVKPIEHLNGLRTKHPNKAVYSEVLGQWLMQV